MIQLLIALSLVLAGCGSDRSDVSVNEDAVTTDERQITEREVTSDDGSRPDEADDIDCGGCDEGQSCVDSSCFVECPVCGDEETCRASLERAECTDTWDCDPLVREGSRQSDSCEVEWTCNRGDFSLRCTLDDSGEAAICVCELNGKAETQFEWSRPICEVGRDDYLPLINDQCGWALPR